MGPSGVPHSRDGALWGAPALWGGVLGCVQHIGVPRTPLMAFGVSSPHTIGAPLPPEQGPPILQMGFGAPPHHETFGVPPRISGDPPPHPIITLQTNYGVPLPCKIFGVPHPTNLGTPCPVSLGFPPVYLGSPHPTDELRGSPHPTKYQGTPTL